MTALLLRYLAAACIVLGLMAAGNDWEATRSLTLAIAPIDCCN